MHIFLNLSIFRNYKSQPPANNWICWMQLDFFRHATPVRHFYFFQRLNRHLKSFFFFFFSNITWIKTTFRSWHQRIVYFIWILCLCDSRKFITLCKNKWVLIDLFHDTQRQERKMLKLNTTDQLDEYNTQNTSRRNEWEYSHWCLLG